MALLAERTFLSRTTLTKIERGEPGVSAGAYASVLFRPWDGGSSGRPWLTPSMTASAVRWTKSGCPSESVPKARKPKAGRVMEHTVLVHVDLGGVSYLVGRLWSRTRKGQESAGF